MKIISWNVNGLRARVKDGSLVRVLSLNADVLCFQELKLSDARIFDLEIFDGYYVSVKLASRFGYSGVCILTKKKPIDVNCELGFARADEDGRYLRVNEGSDCSIISLYMPHGKRDKKDIPYKIEMADYIFNSLLEKGKKRYIICTDFNIAHEDIDLARPRQNINNTMFTWTERKIVDDLLALGYVDAFRLFEKGNEFYSWWPFSFDAYERNVGWRIDYFFVPEELEKKINKVEILKEIRGSDHAPIAMDIEVDYDC